METKTITPLKHQAEILEELDFKNSPRNLIVLPSGAGKTHTLAFDVKRKKPKSFLYVVHRNEILEQSVSIFKEVLGIDESQIGRITGTIRNRKARQRQLFRPYLFATIQTISMDMNLKWLPKSIDYLCIDEYHHVGADSYKKLLSHFDDINYFVGLSATPYRLDQKDIMKFVDFTTIGNIDLLAGIERGILVPFHYVGLWDNVDYSNIKHDRYKYYERDLDKALLIESRDDAIVKEYHDRIEAFNGGDNLTIGFCNSVNHVLRMVDRFNKEGIKAAGISHLDDMEEREKILGDFREGKTKIIFTRDILNEGVDFPECNSIMLLRPTISKTIFFQQIGRGLRKFPNKHRVLILDFIGNYVNAFEKREWLEPFAASTGSRAGVHKPVFNYTPVNMVEFDEKVVSLFEMQKEALRGWTEQDLIDNFYETERNMQKAGVFKDREFKSVGVRDIKDRRFSKISLRQYLNKFGSWNNFLDYIKVEKNKITPTDVKLEQLAEKYFQLKQELSLSKEEVLTRQQFQERWNYFGSKKINKLGGWEAFIKLLGEKKINKCPVCGKKFENTVTNPSIYCSDKCENAVEYKRKKEILKQKPPVIISKVCSNPKCDERFEVTGKQRLQLYCSTECKAIVEHERRRKQYKMKRGSI